MRRLVGVGLLASAFAPVIAVLAILRWHELGVVTLIVLGGCALAIVMLLAVLMQLQRIQHRSIETRTVRRADERVLTFAATYVLPAAVAAIGGDTGITLFGAFVLVALLAVVYVRAGLYHLNPTLAIMGYRLYEVTATNDTVTMLLTRHRFVAQAGNIDCRFVSSDVALEIGAR